MDIYKMLGAFAGLNEHGGNEEAVRITQDYVSKLIDLETPERVKEAGETYRKARLEVAKANTPSYLLHSFQAGNSVPDGTHARAAFLIDNIVAVMDEKEWNAEALNEICELLTAEGYVLRDVNEESDHE